MCVDYSGLNKVCPKDHFPLPCIDQIVDSTSGCKILSFLDAYSGYHQIMMKESDHLMSPFITYQRCMQSCFADQIDPLDQPNQVERPKPTIVVC